MSIMVSINCPTYNHAPYIAAALDGFLMQAADFEYEILIGEDCSADATRAIVLSYQQRHPDRIKLITSDTNVGAKQNSIRLRQNSRGKYIALCEGDDYWTDPHKLQKQVDYMESHPECAMCFHAAIIINEDGTKSGRMIRPHKGDAIMSTDQTIRGGGAMFHLGAIMFPRYVMEEPPQFYCDAPVGDFPIALICATRGTVAYLDQIMSAYRFMAQGSWSEGLSNNPSTAVKCRQEIVDMLDDFNLHTNGQFRMAVLWQKKRLSGGIRFLVLGLHFPRMHRGLTALRHALNRFRNSDMAGL